MLVFPKVDLMFKMIISIRASVRGMTILLVFVGACFFALAWALSFGRAREA